jgi:hypothetical protein
MAVSLFPNKPNHCPYGHSLAPGKPQKVSWLPCMCAPAREAGEQGRGLGHMTVWCGRCSVENQRTTTFYEPPHQVSHDGQLGGWVTRPDVLALRRPRPGRRLWPRGGLRPWTVTMLMIFSAVCALMTLALRADAARLADTPNPARSGRSPPSLSTLIVTS